MAKKPVDRASRTQIIQINKILEEQVTRLDDGLCEYKDPIKWNDARVADEVQCGLSSVRTFRQELFGRLRTVPAQDQQPRIDELERLVTNLLRSYTELADKHDKLVTMLQMNRVVECRHLAITPSIAGAKKTG